MVPMAPHSCSKLFVPRNLHKNFFFLQSAPHPQPIASRRLGGLSRWRTDDQPERADSDADDGDERRRLEGGGQHDKQRRKEVNALRMPCYSILIKPSRTWL